MSQASLITNTSGQSMGILPREGMTCDGRLYPLKMWEPPTLENDGGVWPTPRVGDVSGGDRTKWALQGKWQMGLREAVNIWPTPKHRDFRSPRSPNHKRENPETDLNYKIYVEEGKPSGGQLNPDWVEWLMNFPIGWTSLEPLPKGNFEIWRELNGKTTQRTNDKKMRILWWDHDPATMEER